MKVIFEASRKGRDFGSVKRWRLLCASGELCSFNSLLIFGCSVDVPFVSLSHSMHLHFCFRSSVQLLLSGEIPTNGVLGREHGSVSKGLGR